MNVHEWDEDVEQAVAREQPGHCKGLVVVKALCHSAGLAAYEGLLMGRWLLLLLLPPPRLLVRLPAAVGINIAVRTAKRPSRRRAGPGM